MLLLLRIFPAAGRIALLSSSLSVGTLLLYSSLLLAATGEHESIKFRVSNDPHEEDELDDDNDAICKLLLGVVSATVIKLSSSRAKFVARPAANANSSNLRAASSSSEK